MGRPRPRAQWICSTASRPDTCTIRMGVSSSSERAMARCVASRSTTIGREVAVIAAGRTGPPSSSCSVSQPMQSLFSAWIMVMAPRLSRGGQHLDDLPVPELQVVVGHVDLERRVALVDQHRQLALRHVLGGIRHDQVERVVDHRLAVGTLVVVVHRRLDRAALLLHRERQHGGGATARRRTGAGEEVVGVFRAVVGGLVEVAMAVYAARRDEPAGGVERLGGLAFQALRNGDDAPVAHADVRRVAIADGRDVGVAQDQVVAWHGCNLLVSAVRAPGLSQAPRWCCRRGRSGARYGAARSPRRWS